MNQSVRWLETLCVTISVLYCGSFWCDQKDLISSQSDKININTVFCDVRRECSVSIMSLTENRCTWMFEFVLVYFAE